MRQLLPVIGAHFAVVFLLIVGSAVVRSFDGLPMYILLFVVSLLQGGLMVQAFAPITGSERTLSESGRIVGWIGLIGWYCLHLFNAAVSARHGSPAAPVIDEIVAYVTLSGLVLSAWALFTHKRELQALNRQPCGGEFPEMSEAARLEREREDHLRKQLRFDVRLFYDRYRAELEPVFPEEAFNSYFDSFLTDQTPLDLFEQRAEQLKEMIRDRLEIRPEREKPEFQDIDELLHHFTDRKRRIRELEFPDPEDADVRDTLLSTLDAAQDKAIREFLS